MTEGRKVSCPFGFKQWSFEKMIMMRIYSLCLALLGLPIFLMCVSTIAVAQDATTQNSADITQENTDIIAEANQLLAEQLRDIFKDITALESNISLLQQDIEGLDKNIDGLGNILNRDLSEDELKTLRKKQSKDVAEIILRFQERINFFEQQATELTGLAEELNFRYQPLQEKLEALEKLQAETIIKHDELSDSYDILHDLHDELSDAHDASVASQSLIETQQKDLLELITQQNKLLKKQQKTINKQASSIKTLEKNHNALVKEFQKLVNQLSKTE